MMNLYYSPAQQCCRNIFLNLLTFLILLTLINDSFAEAPYPQSSVISGISFNFSTKKVYAPGSDNWAITWADDGHQYTTWGDGGGFGGTNSNGRVSLGFARVEGGKSSFNGVNVWGGANTSNGGNLGGKSLGILSLGARIHFWRNGTGSNVGAFAQSELYFSDNHLQSVNPAGVKFVPGDFSNNKGFFSPTFLQFGKAYQGARDNYIYIYAPENQNGTWDVQKPGKITLIRVDSTQIHNKSAFKYFAGMTGSNPQWSANINARQPVFSDPVNGVMRTSVSYNSGLNRYFLITQQVSRYKSANAHIGIYDSPTPWGPWTTVIFQNAWNTGLMSNSAAKTVFWNFANKWLSTDGKTFVLVYTDNDEWASVEGTFQTNTVTPNRTPAAPTNLRINP